MQCALSDSQDLGGAAFVVTDLIERELDVGSFHFVQSRALAEFEFGSEFANRTIAGYTPGFANMPCARRSARKPSRPG